MSYAGFQSKPELQIAFYDFPCGIGPKLRYLVYHQMIRHIVTAFKFQSIDE
jgi:hypothetical protein